MASDSDEGSSDGAELNLWKTIAAKVTLLLISRDHPDKDEAERERIAASTLASFINVERQRAGGSHDG